MKRILGLAVAMIGLSGGLAAAQGAGGQAPPPPMTNLQIFPKDTPRPQVLATMQAFTQALGVQCNYCHVQEGRGGRNDMASDEKPTKKAARGMMVLAREINGKLPEAVGKSADATTRVGCATCHRGVPVPRIVGHLVLAGTAVRVRGDPEHAADEPLDGLRVTGLERRLAADDVGVPGRRIGALLGDLPVVLRLGDGERPPPFGLLALVLGLGGLEPGPRLVHPGLARAGAEETAEAGRRDGRKIVPVRSGQGGPERAGIESVFARGGQQPLEGQRPERQDAGQHLAERLHPGLHLSGVGPVEREAAGE